MQDGGKTIGHADGRIPDPEVQRFNGLFKICTDLARDGVGQVVLVLEVRIERTLRDIRLFSDLVDRQGIKAAQCHKPLCRGNKLATGSCPFPGLSRGGCSSAHK